MIVDGWHYWLSTVLGVLIILFSATNLSIEVSKAWKKQRKRKRKEHREKIVFLRVPID